jgi:hypothetical protein
MKILTCIIIIICLFILGCGKISDKPIKTYRSATATEIENFIQSKMPSDAIRARLVFRDTNYLIPTEEWVRKDFSEELSSFLFDFNIRSYKEGRNECDKFSLYGRAVANILNAHNSNKPDTGIAVGEFVYMDGIDPHDINVFIVSDESEKLKLIYYEPQVCQIIEMTNSFAPLMFNF